MHVPGAHRAVAEERQRDPRLAAALERERRADGDRDERAEHRDEREDVALARAEVHVAVAPEGRAGGPPEVVPQDVRDLDAAREVAGHLAVDRGDHVVGAEREARGGGDRLLPVAGVDAARDAPLPVEVDDPVLDEPLQQHEPEQREPDLAGHLGGLRRGLDERGVSRRGAHAVPSRARRPTAGRRPRARPRTAPACRSARGSRAVRRAARSPRRRRAPDGARDPDRAGGLLQHEQARRARDGLEHRVVVERPQRPQVDDLERRLARERLGDAQGEVDARAVGHDRGVAAAARRRARCRSARGGRRPAPRRAGAGRAPLCSKYRTGSSSSIALRSSP